MTYIYPLSGKSSADILQRFKEYQAEVENQLGKKIKRLRTDGGKEFIKVMGQHLKMCGIIHETTAPYTPEQNGVAERANHTIVERVKAIIAEAKLDRKLWMELASAVAYLKNRSPSSAVPTTPYEMWYGERPDLSHPRTLGIKASIHILKQKRIKLDTNSHVGIWLDTAAQTSTGSGIHSEDVVFDEKFYNPEANTENVQVDEPRILHDSIRVLLGPPSDQLPTPPATELESDDESESDQEEITVPPPPAIAPKPTISTTSEQGQRTSSRSNKGTLTSTRFEEENFDRPRRQMKAMIAKVLDPNDEREPQMYQQAINHPTPSKGWEKAIIAEFNALIKNGTWILVKRPWNRKIVSCKWVFKHKKNAIGRIVRLKAQLCARGFTQIPGVDYVDTFAPVVKMASIRILLALAAIYGWEIQQMDVVMAFLAGYLTEEI